MSWRVIVDGRPWPADWGLSKEGAEYFAERFRERLGLDVREARPKD